MEKWLDKITLKGEIVELELLSLQHIEGLTETVNDGDLWKLWYTSYAEPESVRQYIETALNKYDRNLSLPFAIKRITDDKLIGSTSFMKADSKNKRLEIGHTFYAKSA